MNAKEQYDWLRKNGFKYQMDRDGASQNIAITIEVYPSIGRDMKELTAEALEGSRSAVMAYFDELFRRLRSDECLFEEHF